MTYPVKKPTLILDEGRAVQNIKRMATRAGNSRVRFRPHFKTHQSARIGECFRREGVDAITVSNADMAAYFARNGWEDITIAFPCNIREIDEINHLAGDIRLNLLVEAEETVGFLKGNLTSGAGVWIKVDTGYGRTGLPAEHPEPILGLAEGIRAAKQLFFKGLLTHAGHAYHAGSAHEIQQIYHDTVAKMNRLRDILKKAGFSETEISIGDTPTCSIMDSYPGVDEIRPGNFVFYDVMQLRLGACREQDIAVAVACPVVAKHPSRYEIVLYGGAVHFSKESVHAEDGTRIFGYVAPQTGQGWGPMMENTHVASLTQEHGIVRTDERGFQKINVGDLVCILPVHSCLTANLMRTYHTVGGSRIELMK